MRTYKVRVGARQWVEATVGFNAHGAYLEGTKDFEVETWLANGLLNAVEDNIDISIGKQFVGMDPCGNTFSIKRVS